MEIFHVLTLIIILSPFYFLIKNNLKKKKEIKIIEEKRLNEEKIRNELFEKNTAIARKNSINNISIIQAKWKKVQLLDLYDKQLYKKNIVDNESLIIEKGGDKQLFIFLMVDSFLKDFRNKIEFDRNEINFSDEYFEKTKQDIIQDNDTLKIYSIIKKYSDIDDFFESRTKTLEYYENIANSMLVFYLNDSKILYFEIYKAFEKLGVFDTSWQKLILNKMRDIQFVLEDMNDELTELNNNFTKLIDSTEIVLNELKSINSSIKTGNMIQAISAYQLWRINRKINN